jgi:hypothetical protein
MPSDRFYIKFPAEVSTADHCLCNACHNVGRVIKLELPETAYNTEGKLRTKYRPFWLCFNCREKLMSALMWGEEDG